MSKLQNLNLKARAFFSCYQTKTTEETLFFHREEYDMNWSFIYSLLSKEFSTQEENSKIYKDLLQRSNQAVIGQLICLVILWSEMTSSFSEAMNFQAHIFLLGITLFLRTSLTWKPTFFSASLGRMFFHLITFLLSLNWGLLLFKILEGSRENIPLYSAAILLSAALIASTVYSFSSSKRDFITYASILMGFFISHYWNVFATTEHFGGLLMCLAFYGFVISQGIKQNRKWRENANETQRLQLILDAFPGVISLIREGKYVSVNKGIENLFNLRPDSFVGIPVGSFSKDAEFMRNYQEFEELREKRRQFESVLNTDNGKKNLIFIFERLLDPTECIVISMDITSLRSTQSELDEHKQKLVASTKLAALGQMAANLAHEVNTPLAILMARTQQIKSLASLVEDTRPKIKESAEVMERTTQRIAKIVRGLKMFSQNGEVEDHRSHRLDVIIKDTISFCEDRIKSRAIAFEYVNSHRNLEINCNPTQISQVVLNLLNNAIDALSDVPPENAKILLSVEEDKDLAVVKIIDHGPGIPENMRSKIMNPFFTTKDVHSGTGLGLSISKTIVQSHGGDLYFDFNQKVTTVVIRLPLAAKSALPVAS